MPSACREMPCWPFGAYVDLSWCACIYIQRHHNLTSFEQGCDAWTGRTAGLSCVCAGGPWGACHIRGLLTGARICAPVLVIRWHLPRVGRHTAQPGPKSPPSLLSLWTHPWCHQVSPFTIPLWLSGLLWSSSDASFHVVPLQSPS